MLGHRQTFAGKRLLEHYCPFTVLDGNTWKTADASCSRCNSGRDPPAEIREEDQLNLWINAGQGSILSKTINPLFSCFWGDFSLKKNKASRRKEGASVPLNTRTNTWNLIQPEVPLAEKLKLLHNKIKGDYFYVVYYSWLHKSKCPQFVVRHGSEFFDVTIFRCKQQKWMWNPLKQALRQQGCHWQYMTWTKKALETFICMATDYIP